MGKCIYKSILATILLTTAGMLQAKQMDDSKRDTICYATFRFEQNQSCTEKDFADNKYTIALLDSLLTDSSQMVCLDSLVLKVYTSPDGVTDDNYRLSVLRKENLQAYLQQRYPQLDAAKVRAYQQGEDWEGLYQLVMNHNQVPDREDVLALMDFHLPRNRGKLKELLRLLNRGKAYNYLRSEVMPQLRRAELVFYGSQPLASQFTVDTVTVVRDTVLSVEAMPVVQAVSIAPKPSSRRTVIAIKNNLLYDLALAPNIEVELPLGKAWSINAEYKCPWWQNTGKEWCYQMMSGGLEGRYWLGNRQKRNRLTGHFLGLYAEGGNYDLQFKGDGYQGNYYIASGLTYGYAKLLSKHLSIEFSLGVGYLTTEYRKYTPYDESLVGVKSGTYNWIGPTKAKISLVWLMTRKE